MAFKYRARTEEDLEKRATQKGNDFQGIIADDFKPFTPAKGDNWVRILPPTWENPAHYGLDVYVHYSIGPDSVSVICPAKQPHPTDGTFGKCPICEARAKAERIGDEELVKELKVNKRVLVWVLDRKERDKGPMVWSMPWTLDRDICKISRDKRTGEMYVIDHPTRGYDVTFEKEGEKLNTKYVGVQIARKASAVDEEDLDFIEGAPLPFVLNWRDYDEIKELFSGGEGSAPDAPPRHPRRPDAGGAEAPAARRRAAPDPRDEEAEEEAPPAGRRRPAPRPEPEEEEAPAPSSRRRIAQPAPEPEEEEEEAPPPPVRRRMASANPTHDADLDDEIPDRVNNAPPRKAAAEETSPSAKAAALKARYAARK